MKMKSALGMLYALLLCSFPFTCSAAMPEPAELSYWTVNEAYGHHMKVCAEQYNEQQSEVEIQVNVRVYEKQQIVHRLESALRSKNDVPDYVDVPYSDFSALNQTTEMKIYPLNISISRYAEFADSAALIPYIHNEMCFGLPYSAGEMVLLCNRDVWEACSIDISGLTTFEAYLQAGQVIRQQTGHKLLPIDLLNLDLFYCLLSQLQQGRVEDQAVYVSRLITDLVIESQIADIPTTYTIDSDEVVDKLLSGEYASAIVPAEYWQQLCKSRPQAQEKLLTAPVPLLSGAAGHGSSPQVATVLTASGPDINRAKDFLYFCHLSDFGRQHIQQELDLDSWTETPGSETYPWGDPQLRQAADDFVIYLLDAVDQNKN